MINYVKELTTKLNQLYNVLDLMNNNIISNCLRDKVVKDINNILDILRSLNS